MINWTTQGATETINGKIIATDADHDDLTFGVALLKPTAKGGTVSIGLDGSFTYYSGSGDTHAAAATGATQADKEDSFTATVSDGHGGTTDVTVKVTLDPYYQTPARSTDGTNLLVGNNGDIARDNYQKTGTWTTTVTDLDGDSFTWTKTAASNGTVTVTPVTVLIGAGFKVVYTSNSNPVSPGLFGVPPGTKVPADTFTVTFYDGHGGSVTETYTF